MPKTEATKQARNAAITYIAEHHPGDVKAFPHIDRDEFLHELMDHIQHPKRINQENTDFCGPAAVLYALAKDDPLAYAKMGLDLFTTGKATVRGWSVDAGELKTKPMSEDTEIGCCDWVMMASIRTNVGFGALTSVTNSGTLPFEIKSSFENLGYTDVKNETYSTSLWKADEKNLKDASKLWASGYRVVLCVNANMFSKPAESSYKPNHFCTLKSTVRIGNNISCRLWQREKTIRNLLRQERQSM